ncbi:MAG: DinB family protein [Bacteroidota bacterium]
MTALEIITEKVAANQWANRQVLEWLHQQEEDVWDKDVVSSFSTINKLMHHVMEASKYYLSILTGSSETYEKEMPSSKIEEELRIVDQKLVDWLSEQTVDDMAREISLKRSPFVERYTVATLITHMLNHNTYHRGQLVALRHQLGMSDAPKTDHYRFVISKQLAEMEEEK